MRKIRANLRATCWLKQHSDRKKCMKVEYDNRPTSVNHVQVFFSSSHRQAQSLPMVRGRIFKKITITKSHSSNTEGPMATKSSLKAISTALPLRKDFSLYKQ